MQRDSFDPAARTPTAVNKVELVLHVYEDEDGVTQYDATYQFDVLDQDGSPMDLRRGNLLDHLSAQRKTALKGFLDYVFTKAKGSVGP